MRGDLYYFGPLSSVGHSWHKYNHESKRWSSISEIDGFPFRYIDGVFCPMKWNGNRQKWEEAEEGIATRILVNKGNSDVGWTIISFWDRTIDKRGASNSNIIIEGRFPFKDCMAYALPFFPEGRFPFEIKATP
jgi:hypothetical protein